MFEKINKFWLILSTLILTATIIGVLVFQVESVDILLTLLLFNLALLIGSFNEIRSDETYWRLFGLVYIFAGITGYRHGDLLVPVLFIGLGFGFLFEDYLRKAKKRVTDKLFRD